MEGSAESLYDRIRKRFNSLCYKVGCDQSEIERESIDTIKQKFASFLFPEADENELESIEKRYEKLRAENLDAQILTSRHANSLVKAEVTGDVKDALDTEINVLTKKIAKKEDRISIIRAEIDKLESENTKIKSRPAPVLSRPLTTEERAKERLFELQITNDQLLDDIQSIGRGYAVKISKIKTEIDSIKNLNYIQEERIASVVKRIELMLKSKEFKNIKKSVSPVHLEQIPSKKMENKQVLTIEDTNTYDIAQEPQISDTQIESQHKASETKPMITNTKSPRLNNITKASPQNTKNPSPRNTGKGRPTLTKTETGSPKNVAVIPKNETRDLSKAPPPQKRQEQVHKAQNSTPRKPSKEDTGSDLTASPQSIKHYQNIAKQSPERSPPRKTTKTGTTVSNSNKSQNADTSKQPDQVTVKPPLNKADNPRKLRDKSFTRSNMSTPPKASKSSKSNELPQEIKSFTVTHKNSSESEEKSIINKQTAEIDGNTEESGPQDYQITHKTEKELENTDSHSETDSNNDIEEENGYRPNNVYQSFFISSREPTF